MMKYFFSYALLLLVLGCQSSARENSWSADFSKIDSVTEDYDVKVGVWGGSGKTQVKRIATMDAAFNVMQDQLHARFEKEGVLSVHPMAIGLPINWPRAQQLELAINNVGVVGELSIEVFGSRSRIGQVFDLKKGLNEIILDVRNAPLLGGLKSEVLKIKFQAMDPLQIEVHSMILTASDQEHPLVDKWGQLTNSAYDEKVASLAKLTSMEEGLLDSFQKDFQTDVYGGYEMEGISFLKGDYFSLAVQQGNWTLVTPAGNPFYSLGLNGVRRKSTLNNAALTRVKGREVLFEELPSLQECPECYSLDSAYVSFYTWNLKRKYAAYEDWQQQTKYRMAQIGFNSIGNWSDTLMMEAKIPYTYTLDTRVGTGLRAGHHLPDVFHPEFEARLMQAFQEIEKISEDPFLIGYFVDNEMGWGGIDDLDSTSYSYIYLLDYPKEAWQTLFARQYFSVVKRTIRHFDKNHLYLGCRFTRNFKRIQDVIEQAAAYVDVLSINVYSMFTIDEMNAWHRLTHKPILIGEHHVPPDTKRALLPRYQAFTVVERDSMLANYLDTWTQLPYAVGSHWYQYVDQEVSGRADGGENQPVGLVSITDKLDEGLARQFHQLSNTIHKNYKNRLNAIQ